MLSENLTFLYSPKKQYLPEVVISVTIGLDDADTTCGIVVNCCIPPAEDTGKAVTVIGLLPTEQNIFI